MMWQLFHKAFGWHYVWIQDCEDTHILRVTRLPSGELMGKIVSRAFFISTDGKATGGYGIRGWKPLTWVQEFRS